MNAKILILAATIIIAMCMIVPAAAQPTPFLIYGSAFDTESAVVNSPNVRVTNLDTDESWNAETSSIYNYYQLVLENSSEVKEGDSLRIIAINESSTGYHIINVTDYPVTATEINGGGMFNFNLTLDEFYLNLVDFPMCDANGSACSSLGDEEHKMCGPATAQMNLNYMWWNSSAEPEPPEIYNQSYLYDYGISHNANISLPYFDTRGMWYTIQYLDPSPYWEYGYNFGLESSTDQNHMLKLICHWICYTVGTVGGHKEGHPYHVPGAVPAYGDYTNWMSVRGVHTNKDACPSPWVTPDDLEVYGFWVNDPYPASMGGIGENSYKTADEWLATYYKPLTTGDAWDGKYVAILEPPEEDDGSELRIAQSKARFSGTITAEATDEELTVDVGGVPLNQLICNRKLVREKENKVVQAAIDGVNDELIPYDPDFAAAFDGTVAGKPMPVKSDAGDYYLVPFGIASESESDSKSVLAVVIVDSDGGKFKEASWVKEPVKYLSVTPQEALKIVYKEMKGKSTVKVLKKDKATGKLKKADVIDENVDTLGDITLDETEKQRRKAYLELVYKGESPYYPVWKITIGDSIFFVDQSGTLTYNEPVSTPTPTPKLIKYSDTQVLIE